MSDFMIKYVRRQDCGWKQAAGCSGETSINLSNEILAFLTGGMVDFGEECGFVFKIYKEDFVDAISFIKTQLPLFRSSSKSSQKIYFDDPFLVKLENSIYSFFQGEVADYTVTLYRRGDKRIYLKDLRQNGFSVRDYLVEFSSALKFIISENGFELRLLSAVSEEK